MRQLFPPRAGPVDAAEVYGDPPAVRLNMISSVDGAATVGGRSGQLGGPADHEVFEALRSLADVVLVAAGTVRAEGYRPAAGSPIAVVSRSLDLDYGSSFFTEAVHRPVLITIDDAPPSRLAHAARVADMVFAGTGSVDLRKAVTSLHDRGYQHVLAEGGPSLNGQLAAAGVLDELCLTLAPVLVAGTAQRIVNGGVLDLPDHLELRSIGEQDGFLFLRYGVGREL